MSLTTHHFQKTIDKDSLFTKSDKLLVGVSGGIDSMVLCDLLHTGGYRFEMAHMNYQLRGEESAQDEKWIHDYADKHGIVHHVKRVDTALALSPEKSGVQETARNLRYAWFNELAETTNASFILTAHHADDQAETILFQFLRGGMLPALRGMRVVQGNVVRPLLSFSRKEILAYAMEQNIQWREDSSNASIKYKRNLVRHEIIPILEKINPAISDSLVKRAAIFSEIEQLVSDVIQKDITKNIASNNGVIKIAVQWLASYPYKTTLLWHVLQPLGFSSAQMDDVLSLSDAQSGAHISGDIHTVWRDREHLIISPIAVSFEDQLINELPFEIFSPIQLIGKKTSDLNNAFHCGNNEAYLNPEKISLPLTLRKWRDGDRLIPLGMTGHQKLSDFFIQKKIPMTEKNHVLVLESGGEIAWIVGHRISESFKLLDDSIAAFHLKWEK